MSKLTLILIFCLLLLAACETRVTVQEGTQVHMLTVQGSAEFEVFPDDIASVTVRVETKAPTAQEAQAQNAQVSDAVTKALSSHGVSGSSVETTGYYVQQIREWDYSRQKTVDSGYQVTNTLQVSSSELDGIGRLLDAIVQAGGLVDHVSFELSDARESEVKTEALRQASRHAREKAEVLATASNVRLGKAVSISEQSFNIMPYRAYDMVPVAMEAKAETAVSPRDVQVSVQVSVSYEII
ncbi:hypothetical protein COV18_06815 [Candidatus Woesearchaeota archaeon CG10_big_fil_rev_8_21_14_0_10_37_12]|nr:MAG: hypothetical protein COV18_06815 [Candidatus Woesearchaeota archaeon CG10_big_fil_rev_8_21_14_0_10_37_12]